MELEAKDSLENIAGITPQQLVAMYKLMWTIRLFEEKIEALYQQGEIHGTMHLCIGQEATAVGSGFLLKREDWMTSTHRNHGHAIAKGTSVRAMFAEILGRKTGTNQGKGGSMHITDISVGNLGGNGIVGAGFPIATGAALTAQLKETDQVVICYSGDGAVNEGSFHEALNLAAIWKLPVIFFIENNQYGMSSPIDEMVAIEHLSERSKSYGIPGVTIDGNDLIEVINTTYESIQRAKNGQGPTLIEAKTYRFKGHSKSDKLHYRSREEEDEYRLHQDPIYKIEKRLIACGVLRMDERDVIIRDIQKELDELVMDVLKDPRPQLEDLTTDVYRSDLRGIR